jgi:hypothetical protein
LGLGGAGTRAGSKAAVAVLKQLVPAPVGVAADVSLALGQAELARRDIVDVPTVFSSLGIGPGGAVALDLFGIGETVSAGDIQRLTQRLAACQAQVRATGLPVALGSLSGKNLDVIETGLRYALKQDRSARSIRTIREGDALLRQAGYAGYTDPRIRDDGGIGGPNFRRLQRTVREGL